MALTLAEGLIEALITYIDANIAAKLTALDTEYTDSLVLAAPVKTIRSPKRLISIPDFPVFFAFAIEERIRPWQAIGTAAVVEAKPRAVIGIVVADQAEEDLQRRLYRYGRALTELVLAAQGTNALSDWNVGTDEEWRLDWLSAPYTGSAESSFIGEVFLEFGANKIEQK